jgi:hypothetical protein
MQGRVLLLKALEQVVGEAAVAAQFATAAAAKASAAADTEVLQQIHALLLYTMPTCAQHQQRTNFTELHYTLSVLLLKAVLESLLLSLLVMPLLRPSISASC